MDTLIHVDFQMRRRTTEAVSPQPKESEDLLEQVVSTYLTFHKEVTRTFARQLIIQGLMFQRSLVEREAPESVAT